VTTRLDIRLPDSEFLFFISYLILKFEFEFEFEYEFEFELEFEEYTARM
jgi:hypothetical protein